jgi:hypothetical protein
MIDGSLGPTLGSLEILNLPVDGADGTVPNLVRIKIPQTREVLAVREIPRIGENISFL